MAGFDAKALEALSAVDWTSRVAETGKQTAIFARLVSCNERVSVWVRQIVNTDPSDIARPFLYELQSAGRDGSTLASLGLYRAASSSIRVVAECALYYVYFREHAAELRTLARKQDFYLSKSQLVEYLKVHIEDYSERQQVVNLTSAMNDWYKRISAVVHGQVPGEFPISVHLADQVVSSKHLLDFVKLFEQSVAVVDGLFKVCLAPTLWQDFSTTAKRYLTKGMASPQRHALGLDRG